MHVSRSASAPHHDTTFVFPLRIDHFASTTSPPARLRPFCIFCAARDADKTDEYDVDADIVFAAPLVAPPPLLLLIITFILPSIPLSHTHTHTDFGKIETQRLEAGYQLLNHTLAQVSMCISTACVFTLFLSFLVTRTPSSTPSVFDTSFHRFRAFLTQFSQCKRVHYGTSSPDE